MKNSSNKSKLNKSNQRDGRIITKIPQPVAPNSVLVRLTWIDTNTQINNSGSNFVSKRYRVNGTYDLDPLVGGTAVAGFNEWAAIYHRYRVVSARIDSFLANLDSNFVQAVMLPLNVDPGSTPTIGQIQSWPMQPFSKTTQLSARGGMDRSKLSMTVSIPKFSGVKGAIYDDSFTSIINTVPTNLVFVALGFLSLGGNFTSGIAATTTVSMDVEFFERNELTV